MSVSRETPDGDSFGQLVNNLNEAFALRPVKENATDAENQPCWDCIKGRHSNCTGHIPARAGETVEMRCRCPVCHANMDCERQPVYDEANRRFYDPGPSAEPERYLPQPPPPHRNYYRG